MVFGASVRGSRIRFRLDVSYVEKHSGLARSRIIEIEAGVEPWASESEVRALARAIGMNGDNLVLEMPSRHPR